jgi:TPR repeat protein
MDRFPVHMWLFYAAAVLAAGWDGATLYEEAEALWYGKGRNKDRAMAAVLYKRSADEGYAPGQFKVGDFRWSGEFAPRDRLQAVSYYRKAALQDYIPAVAKLAHILWDPSFPGHNRTLSRALYLTAARLLPTAENVSDDQKLAAQAVYEWGTILDDAALSQIPVALCVPQDGQVPEWAVDPPDYCRAEAGGYYKAAADAQNEEAAFAYGVWVYALKDDATHARKYFRKVRRTIPLAAYQYALLVPAGRAGKSVKWLGYAADRGVVDAQCEIAKRLLRGEGVLRDRSAAIKYFWLAAKQNHTSAAFTFAILILNRSAGSKLKKRAVKALAFAAGKGHALAQFRFAELLWSGQYVSQDRARARDVYANVVKSANASQKCLRVLLDGPDGPDYEVTARLVVAQSSAELTDFEYDYVPHSFYRAEPVPKNPKLAVGLLRRQFANGNATAGFLYAEILYFGLNGKVRKARALDTYREVANSNASSDLDGVILAKYRLIHFDMLSDDDRGQYTKSLLLKPNVGALVAYADAIRRRETFVRLDREALELYKFAADGESPHAQYRYASLLWSGTGVSSDREKAYGYFSAAAEAGYAPALFRVGSITWDRNPAAAVVYFQQAADLGHARACYRYAELLSKGQYVPSDQELASYTYDKAAYGAPCGGVDDFDGPESCVTKYEARRAVDLGWNRHLE